MPKKYQLWASTLESGGADLRVIGRTAIRRIAATDIWGFSEVLNEDWLAKMMAERTLLRVAFFELILVVPTFYLWPPTECTDIKTTATIIAIFSLVVLVAFISLDSCLKRRIKVVYQTNQSQA